MTTPIDNVVTLGSGASIVSGIVGSTLNLLSLVSGNNVTITPGSTSLSFAVNIPSNYTSSGIGLSLINSVSSSTVTLNSLVAGTGIGLSNLGNGIVITASPQGVNTGSGTGIYIGQSSGVQQFKSLVQGSGIILTNSSTSVTISGTSAGVSAAENIGPGVGVFAQEVNGILQFNSLVAGSNITINPMSGYLVINAPGGGVYNGVNLGSSGSPIFAGVQAGTNLFQFKQMLAGNGITITDNGTNLQFAASQPIMVNAGSSNDGASIFSSSTFTGNASQYYFNRITGLTSDVQVGNSGNSVTIGLSSNVARLNTPQLYLAQQTVSANILVDNAIINWNLNQGNVAILSLIPNYITRTIQNPSNMQSGGIYYLMIKNTAGQIINWGSNYQFENNVPPTISSQSNGVEIIQFVSDGTHMYGSSVIDTTNEFSSLFPIPNNTILGNVSGVISLPNALTSSEFTSLVNLFTSSTSGTVPASGGGIANFLRADGSWSAVPGAVITNGSEYQPIVVNSSLNGTVNSNTIQASPDQSFYIYGSIDGGTNPGPIYILGKNGNTGHQGGSIELEAGNDGSGAEGAQIGLYGGGVYSSIGSGGSAYLASGNATHDSGQPSGASLITVGTDDAMNSGKPPGSLLIPSLYGTSFYDSSYTNIQIFGSCAATGFNGQGIDITAGNGDGHTTNGGNIVLTPGTNGGGGSGSSGVISLEGSVSVLNKISGSDGLIAFNGTGSGSDEYINFGDTSLDSDPAILITSAAGGGADAAKIYLFDANGFDGANAGGSIYMFGGTDNTSEGGASIELDGGYGNNSGGGQLLMYSGSSAGGNCNFYMSGGNYNGVGGVIELTAGTDNVGNAAGEINIYGGQGSGNGGGPIQILAGNGTGSGSPGGYVILDTGIDEYSDSSAQLLLRSPYSGASSLTGANVSSDSGIAGQSIDITAGNGDGTTTGGGNVTLTPGTNGGGGSGNQGNIILADVPTSDPDVTHAIWNNNGTIVFSGSMALVGFTATNDTALGQGALSTQGSTSTEYNTAVGAGAGQNYTGNSSVFIGTDAANSLSTGNFNVAIGDSVVLGDASQQNVIIGAYANINGEITSGSVMIGEGCYLQDNATNVIVIGQSASAKGSSSIVIGQDASSSATGGNSVVIGTGSTDNSNNATVIGQGLGASNNNDVIIGVGGTTLLSGNISTGSILNGATGGHMGSGTLNATGLYVNSEAVAIGNGVQTANILLTSSEILALNGTPQQLVAAPGADRVIVVLSSMYYLSFGGVAYLNDLVGIYYGTGLRADTGDQSILTETSFGYTGGTGFIAFQGTGTPTSIWNQPLNVWAPSNPTTGNGSLLVVVNYITIVGP